MMANFSSTGSPPTTLNFGGYVAIIFMVYNVFALVGNLLIIKSVPRIPSDAMGSPTKVCLVGQAVTDAVVSTLMIIGPLSEIVGDWTGWTYGRLSLCRVIGIMVMATVGVSITQIALLNTDRYLFITKPMIYPRIATRKRVLVASISLSALHVLPLLLFIGINYASEDIIQYDPVVKMCTFNPQNRTFPPFSFLMFSEVWLTFLALVFGYVHIIKISRNHLKLIKPRVPAAQVFCRSQMIDQDASISVVSAPRPVNSRADVQGNIEAEHKCDTPADSVGSSIKVFNDGENTYGCPVPHVTITFNEPTTANKGTQNCNMETTLKSPARSLADNLEENLSPKPTHSLHMPSCSSNGHLTSGLPPAVPQRRQRQDVRPIRQPEPSQLRHNLRILRTPLVITFCYFFSFLPVTLMNAYLASTGRSVPPLFHAFFTILVAFNGGVNIVVYHFTIKPFRTVLKNLIKRR